MFSAFECNLFNDIDYYSSWQKKHIDYTDQTNYTDRAINKNQSVAYSNIKNK